MVPNADTWREKGNQKQLKTGEYNSICKGSPVSHRRGSFINFTDRFRPVFAGLRRNRTRTSCTVLSAAGRRLRFHSLRQIQFSDKVSVNFLRKYKNSTARLSLYDGNVVEQLQTETRHQCWSIKLELSASQRNERHILSQLEFSPNYPSQPHDSFPPSGAP